MRRPTIVFGDLLTDLDSRQGKLVSYTMYLLNLGFICLYILGTFEYFEQYSLYIQVLEFILGLIFTFEYFSRIDCAEDTWSEITDPYSIADIVAVLPSLLVVFVPVLGSLTAIRSIQFLRIFRFIRISLENDRFFRL